MKKFNKLKPRAVKELVSYFDNELQTNLPITQLPDGSLVYKNYIVKQLSNANWGIFNISNKEMIDQFYLKSCALMAAKAYNNVKLEKYFEIKRLDNRYWAHYCDTMIFKHNIKTAKDFDRYVILLNKLEHSTSLTAHYKEEISRMFKWSFV